MLFISPQKFFSFSRYLNFCLDFLLMWENGLIRRQNLVNKHLRYTYVPKSQEVKEIKQ